MTHSRSVIEAMLRQEERYAVIPGENKSLSAKRCRNDMLRSLYKLVGPLGMERGLVSIVASHFDRYCGTKSGRKVLTNPKRAELVGLGCFYLAQKTYEHEVLSAQDISVIFGEAHSGGEIENMEVKLLECLEWHVHPPTAVTFIRNIIDSADSEDIETRVEIAAVADMATMQVEMSLFDRRTTQRRASVVAVAALVNALECLDVRNPWYVVPLLYVIENITFAEMEETRKDMNKTAAAVSPEEVV